MYANNTKCEESYQFEKRAEVAIIKKILKN